MLVALPIALIVLITIVDLSAPSSVHLGPLLVIAPALTPSFAGPRLTAAVGALAIAAQVLIAVLHGGLTTSNHVAQIAALTVLSTLIVIFTVIRERRSRQLARVQSVAEEAQRALLRPLPERIGPLRIATMYLAAEHEAQIGGDLYTATRAGDGTRLIIGDVRGKGLAAVGESALLLSAFRLVATRHPTLPELAHVLDRSVGRYLLDFAETGEETVEHFITALLIDIPDGEPVTRLTNCGHPPPLVLSHGKTSFIDATRSAPPLGVHGLSADEYPDLTYRFDTDDTLLLYTDGVTEARDGHGAFYPLAERVTQWAKCEPAALVDHIRRDLLAHAGGHLGDDAALIAIRRAQA
ncbi:PP2C family protein-serine/threonine phosphatase [Yinghuangia seranimata]|nr:PP2C family protein-serine/threonine phosphatase [Yinghuangia seranimata]MDI2128448.1 PP2C family protein-serine/threonine phosphatase [Yinghuangia seranimata]